MHGMQLIQHRLIDHEGVGIGEAHAAIQRIQFDAEAHPAIEQACG